MTAGFEFVQPGGCSDTRGRLLRSKVGRLEKEKAKISCEQGKVREPAGVFC